MGNWFNSNHQAIWKSTAVNLIVEMFIKEVNIESHYLFTYRDKKIYPGVTTRSHQDLIKNIISVNDFPPGIENTFMALKHALEKVEKNSFVCLWTDQLGKDRSNALLRQQIVNLKAATNSEIFFMVIPRQWIANVLQPVDISVYKNVYDDIGHVMDIEHDPEVIPKMIQIIKKAALCN